MTTMLYKSPGPHELHGGRFDYHVVADSAVDAALADGWFRTTDEARAAAKDEEDAKAARDAEAAEAIQKQERAAAEAMEAEIARLTQERADLERDRAALAQERAAFEADKSAAAQAKAPRAKAAAKSQDLL